MKKLALKNTIQEHKENKYKALEFKVETRTNIHKLIEEYVAKIYLKLHNDINPNFEKDETWEFDIEFEFHDMVFNTYDDDYVYEKFTAKCIRGFVDGTVVLLFEDNDEESNYLEEQDIYELTTDEMFDLAYSLEYMFNGL